MTSGSVRISRDIFDDAAFKNEPLSEREAFMWLIMEASFKEREKRIGRVAIHLKRGELAASIRFMQEAWGWASTRRVHGFIGALQKRNMVEVRTETGVTVIKLCNYDKYQSGGDASGTLAEREKERSRNAGGTNENKDEIREEVETIVSTKGASARAHLVPVLGDVLTDAFLAHRKALKAPMTEHAGKLMAKKLATMSDPAAVVEQSIAEGWKGIFPVKPAAEVHHFPSRGRTYGERVDDAFSEASALVAQRPF